MTPLLYYARAGIVSANGFPTDVERRFGDPYREEYRGMPQATWRSVFKLLQRQALSCS